MDVDCPGRFDGCTEWSGALSLQYTPGPSRAAVDGLSIVLGITLMLWSVLMAQRPSLPAQQVQVAERGTFLDGHRTVAGYVARKGRTYAHVVTDEATEVRVPDRLLAAIW